MLVLAVVAVSCADPTVAAPGAGDALPTLTCHAAYRDSVERGIQREETVELEPASDDTIPFPDASIGFQYSFDEGEGAALVTTVTTREGREFHQTLYQLGGGGAGDDLQLVELNSFLGGHGFTGLNYAYPPGSDAEVQYWCAAE